MARPLWKGTISFGLVNIPVELYPAEKPKELQFKLLDKRNFGRIRYERINEETGKVVPWDQVVQGYDYDGDYVILTDQDFQAVSKENPKVIEIEEFIPEKEMEYPYLEKPYYVKPGKGGDKGYVLLRESLKQKGKVGIGRVMIRTKQYLAAIIPYKDAILVDILRYPYELRKTSELELPSGDLKKYHITKKELDIASQLIDSMTVHWKPDHYHDEYHDELLKWIEKKAKSGKKTKISKGKKEAKAPKSTKVIDFMELLKKSIKEKKRKPAKAKKKANAKKTKHKKAS